ncbi:hypothetical protein VFPBJ_02644 [Purpureocillium lilacinum]|uniref:Uncharacterized protein n=1 Tax=Purpureocillium lilacinum TaxID=33203 RepID=A0A179H0W2_PURLI|nr:hypothetical protein VFPBJ_02644 [Purpureocillium lilacinum]
MGGRGPPTSSANAAPPAPPARGLCWSRPVRPAPVRLSFVRGTSTNPSIPPSRQPRAASTGKDTSLWRANCRRRFGSAVPVLPSSPPVLVRPSASRRPVLAGLSPVPVVQAPSLTPRLTPPSRRGPLSTCETRTMLVRSSDDALREFAL